jgi:hypothetical protein
MFSNQGSAVMLNEVDCIAEELMRRSGGEVIRINGGVTVGAVRNFIKNPTLIRIIKAIHDVGVCNADPFINKALEDGLLRTNRLKILQCCKLFSRLHEFAYRRYWDLAAIFLKGSSNYDSIKYAIVPDETYGMALITKVLTESNKTIIGNINSDDFGLCIQKASVDDGKYEYTLRPNWRFDDGVVIGNDKKELLNNYFDGIFNSKSDHADYALTYANTKKRITPVVTNKINVLIAAHIFCDAASLQVFDFKDFIEWITVCVKEFTKNPQCAVYVKEHPASSRYGEVGLLEKIIEKNDMSYKPIIIKSDEKIETQDFDLIVSCNGSIIYEAIYKKTPCLNCSDGFVKNLAGVETRVTKDKLINFIEGLTKEKIIRLKSDIDVNAEKNTHVMYDWHIRRKLNLGACAPVDNKWSEQFGVRICDLIQGFESSDSMQVRIINNHELTDIVAVENDAEKDI